jgi:hypothetical protein
VWSAMPRDTGTICQLRKKRNRLLWRPSKPARSSMDARARGAAGTLSLQQPSNGLLVPRPGEETIIKSKAIRVMAAGAAAVAIGIYVQRGFFTSTLLPKSDAVSTAVQKGTRWLVSAQGEDGVWGQDGGETSYVRQGEHLESQEMMSPILRWRRKRSCTLVTNPWPASITRRSNALWISFCGTLNGVPPRV